MPPLRATLPGFSGLAFLGRFGDNDLAKGKSSPLDHGNSAGGGGNVKT